MINLFNTNGSRLKQDQPIGLIAGTGDFPCLIAQAVHERGIRLVVTAVERDDVSFFKDRAFVCEQVAVSQGQRIIDLLKKNNVRQTLMGGGIPKKKVYQADFKPDGITSKVLSSLKLKGDDQILRAVSSVLKLNGIQVISPIEILKDKITPARVLTRRAPTEQEQDDIRFGLKIARDIGRMDIGQLVVVKGGSVLAVEAIEGTNRTLERVRDLNIPGSVAVKVSKPQQDLRFDMPVVGPETVQAALLAGCSVLAIEAGKTIILHRDQTVQRADEHKFCILGIS